MRLLEGKKALVTGGSSGIGYAIVSRLLEEGALVTFFGQSQERGEAALNSYKEAYPQASIKFMAVDVSKTEAVDLAIKSLLVEWGGVDILVNNAGITKDQIMMKMSEEDWDLVLDTNAKSCFNTTRSLSRSMLKQKSGRIINISSVIGLIGNAGQVNYAASKGAIIAMTKALAHEFASRNILVNCIAPGFIETKMTDSLTEEQKESILSKVPLGRMGKGKEVADLVVFLASPLSSYITGQVIAIDGGMTMR